MMLLGREVRLPHEVVFGSTVGGDKYEQVASYGEHVVTIRNHLQKAHELARKHLGRAAEHREANYDLKVHYEPYRVGDLVWVKNEAKEVGVCPKLQPAFVGPYVVCHVIGKVNIEVQVDTGGKRRVLHYDKLKRYTGVNPPKWVSTLANKVVKDTKKVTHKGTQTHREAEL